MEMMQFQLLQIITDGIKQPHILVWQTVIRTQILSVLVPVTFLHSNCKYKNDYAVTVICGKNSAQWKKKQATQVHYQTGIFSFFCLGGDVGYFGMHAYQTEKEEY